MIHGGVFQAISSKKPRAFHPAPRVDHIESVRRRDLVATGGLYFEQDHAYLCFGAARCDYCGRGLRKSLLSKRIEEARRRKATFLSVSVPSPASGASDPSLGIFIGLDFASRLNENYSLGPRHRRRHRSLPTACLRRARSARLSLACLRHLEAGSHFATYTAKGRGCAFRE
jgi:hypothetical protein